MTFLTNSLGSVISDGNSSATPLGAGAVFTGTGELNTQPDVMISGKTDQDGLLEIQFSPDGTNWDSSIPTPYTANSSLIRRFIKGARYFRIVFTNTSASAQTFFRFSTIYGVFGSQLTKTVGAPISATEDAITARIIDTEFLIGSGLFTSAIKFNKFGRNDDVDAPEDIWDGGGLYTGFPVQNETIEIFSSSANDTSAGTGARTITIYGLDGGYNLQEETVTLNGTTGVTTTNTFRRVHRVLVMTAGSSESNEGTITVRHSTTTANVFSVIQIGHSQSSTAIFTIPSGHTGYMVNYNASINDSTNNRALMGIICRDITNTTSRILRPFSISTNYNFVSRVYGALRFTEMTDIKFRVLEINNSNGDITANFDIVLLPNA